MYPTSCSCKEWKGTPGSIEFSETIRGRPLLLYEGRSYTLKRILQNKNKRWICRTARCKGTLITCNNDVVEEGNHTCIPDVAKTEIQKCIVKCKKRVREELTPMKEVYKETFSPVLNMGPNFVTHVPKFESIKSQLYHNRFADLGSCSLPAKKEENDAETTSEDSTL